MANRKLLEKQAKQTLLTYLSDVPFVHVEPATAKPYRKQAKSLKADVLLTLKYRGEKRLLVVEAKDSGQPKTARQAINQLRSYLAQFPEAHGVLFAPYISPQTAALCREEGIGYADLAGNCHLNLPQIYIRREDWPNPIKQKRVLRSLYSPKAARVLHVLLITAGERKLWKVEALAKEARVSLGQVSNVKKLLADREWIHSEPGGFWLSAPQDLLEEWSANYNYRKHDVHDYYSLKDVADIEADLANLCEKEGIRYGFTGFSAATRLAPSVRHQRAMVYILDHADKVAKKLGLKKVETGANLSVIVPTNDGVLYGIRTAADGAQLVSPIQVYLDLKGYRGRGEEAAQAVFEKVIEPTWP